MDNAAQKIQYLGHWLNLKDGRIEPLERKTALSLKRVRHQLKGNTVQPKNLAALGGNLLDAVKSNVNLHGLPQQVMKQAAAAVKQNAQQWGLKHSSVGAWTRSTWKPPGLQLLLQQVAEALAKPVAQQARGMNHGHR